MRRLPEENLQDLICVNGQRVVSMEKRQSTEMLSRHGAPQVGFQATQAADASLTHTGGHWECGEKKK